MKIKSKEFTEQEALAYFAKMFKSYDYTIVSGEWNTFVVNFGYGFSKHKEWCYDVSFRLNGNDNVYTFSMWIDYDKLYGEWL